LIDPAHRELSMVQQCELLGVNRSGLYYQPRGETALNLALMRLIDGQFLETPWYGARQMARHLRREGHVVGRKRMRRLMGLMGLTPIYQPPRTTVPHPGHRLYPYLVRGLTIDRPNQVWCADITYVPMRRGFFYLVAVMDWATRKVLSWRLSNTLEVEFCLEAVEEALADFGQPEIFNTDRGSQFTSPQFSGMLEAACRGAHPMKHTAGNAVTRRWNEWRPDETQNQA
jgi:putative transposase